MKVEGWKYYNHAVIPTSSPHEEPNLEAIANKTVWSIDGAKPYFARWTSDFDCGYETSWWYVIREAPFDMNEFSYKQKKKMRAALKKCTVKIISPINYVNELYDVYDNAYRRYKLPDNKRNYDEFLDAINEDVKNGIVYWAGFENKSNRLVGYITILIEKDYVETLIAKYHPDYMKSRVSDALHIEILKYYLNIENKKYILSGTRSINHVTDVQNYNIDTFKYRKAYCKLHLQYRQPYGLLIKILYFFRKILVRFDNNKIVHDIISVLKMEEIVRQSK